MLAYILALISIPALGAVYLYWGKRRTLRGLKEEMEEKILHRLGMVAAEIGGSVADGPCLQSSDGRLVLYASQAPASWVIDVTKFTAPVAWDLKLVVVRAEDAGKVMVKGLTPLAPPGFEGSESHRVYCSDPAVARALFTRDFAAKIRTIERETRSRSRLQVFNGTATLTLSRGLEEMGELLAFYRGCVDVTADLKPPPKT